MEEKVTMKSLRREVAPMSRVLLIYYLLMNLVVAVVASIDATVQMFVSGGAVAMDQAMVDALMTNYWGYLLTIVIGFSILISWKGMGFFREEIWKVNRAMGLSTFLLLMTWLYAVQIAFTVFNTAVDSVLQNWGMTTERAVEAATMVSESPSMFLYVGIFGPIAEELLFRGLILRSFLPKGKKFAVVTSAVLFGFYHGNLVQSPMAFLIGLILGYTAVEYNIAWAMVLHVGNNLILGDTLPRVLGMLHPILAALLENGLLMGLLICWLVVTFMKIKRIAAWICREKMDWRAFGAVFQCPSTIILLSITIASMVLGVV